MDQGKISHGFHFLLYLNETDPICVQSMMDFELKLEKPNISRAWISAATMGFAYFIGSSPHPTHFCSQH